MGLDRLIKIFGKKHDLILKTESKLYLILLDSLTELVQVNVLIKTTPNLDKAFAFGNCDGTLQYSSRTPRTHSPLSWCNDMTLTLF